MSFKANKYGLYDMGGNVWQWCEDWYNAAKIERVLRGGLWNDRERGKLLTSCRFPGTPDHRNNITGFRVVVSSSAP